MLQKEVGVVETIVCPYCKEQNHTSNPSVMAECAYCGWRFAEAKNQNQTLLILDREMPGVWDLAEEFMSRWQESGELEKEAIVDRRISDESFTGPGRRSHRDKKVIA